jgi:hypothetical protein
VIDWTITIGNIVEIGSIIVGGLGVLFTIRNDVISLKHGASDLKDQFGEMQREVKKLGDVLVNLADIRGEIRVLDTRITAAEQDVRELRSK